MVEKISLDYIQDIRQFLTRENLDNFSYFFQEASPLDEGLPGGYEARPNYKAVAGRMDGLVVKISPMGFKTCFEIFGPDIWLDLDGKINYRDIVPVFYSSRGGSPLEIFVAKGRDIVPIDFIDRIVLAASETGELDRKMTEKLRTNLLEKYSKFTARGLNGKGNEYSKKLWME